MGITDFDQIPYIKYPKDQNMIDDETQLWQKTLKLSYVCSILCSIMFFFYFLVVAAMFIIGLLSFLRFLKSLTDPTLYNNVYFR